jgi:hypothetical protein
VASLGYAGDAIDAYTVDVPAGRTVQAMLRGDVRGLMLGVLPVKAGDERLQALAREGTGASHIALPAGRSILVVARAQGAGPYRLALSGA